MNTQTANPSLPSSSSSAHQWKYDVFLSFRGEDTRKNFTDHLYPALLQRGINTFRDDTELERGKSIAPELLKAIAESRISVVIFSRNYASSTWCLDELVKIVECRNEKGQVIIPIFYNVDPSEVRKQAGSFQEAFAKHEEDFKESLEKVQDWRAAMRKVGGISGFHLMDRHESEFIQGVVEVISKKWSPVSLTAIEDLIGIDLRLEELCLHMAIGWNDVRMIGISGMGGIGKTTLARVVYSRMSSHFEGTSFLANVREASKEGRLVSLQEQLLHQILEERNVRIWNVHDEIDIIRNRLCNKRVLVVIDDVDQLDQLKKLAGKHDWFGLGSRIIITTRDEHLLVAHGVDTVYKAEGLSDDEALQLLSLKTRKSIHTAEDFMELSKHIVRYADGLPLALEVLGSFLCGRSLDEWESALERLKDESEKEILDRLKITFDGLRETEKQLFLDIAHFFKGYPIDDVTKILENCGFYPRIGIPVLIGKSLIHLEKNLLWMHDLIHEMGWKIVKQESPAEPGKRSRLCGKDACHVLMKQMGTNTVESIVLKLTERVDLNSNAFSNLNRLRLLRICNVQLSQGLECLSNELRFLEWRGYPLKSLPSSFQPGNIVKIDMSESRIERLWEGVLPLNKLKSIILNGCGKLKWTPDFTGVPNLEMLLLKDCTSLVEVHSSIGHLKKLLSLNLTNCQNLRSLPRKIQMDSLEELMLSNCSKLSVFPDVVGKMDHLWKLYLDHTAIKELPSSIECLTSLAVLCLRGCKSLVSLPSSIRGLKSLRTLDLSGCSNLFDPENLWQVACWDNVDASRTSMRLLPSTICLLNNSTVVSFCGCKGLPPKSPYLLPHSYLMPRENPNPTGRSLNTLLSLCCLRVLNLSNCNIGEGVIPYNFGSLSSLEVLDLSGNSFVSLQASINQLCKLHTLHLNNCRRLVSLPKLPLNIEHVSAADCTSLEKLSYPCSLSSLPSPTFCGLNCYKLVKNQGCGMALTLLKRYLQVITNQNLDIVDLEEFDGFRIVIPGSEIPEWFNHQSEGSSLSMQWPSDLCNNREWMGYALCAVCRVHEQPYRTLAYSLIANGEEVFYAIDYFSHMPTEKFCPQDHLWLFYQSRYSIIHGTRWQNEHGDIEFLFDSSTVEVQKCGARVVFLEDVEELNQTTIPYNSSIFECSGDLNQELDGSAVDGELINQLYDDYDGGQSILCLNSLGKYLQ